MKRFTAQSVFEFVRFVCEINSGLVRNGANKNEILLFRGHSKNTYELVPSIARGRRSSVDITIFNEEENLISLAQYKLPDVFKRDLSPIELLALLQHFGVPTRLLDVTENALAALYFACCSNNAEDGEVFAMVHNEQDIRNYPVYEGIAESYKFAQGTDTPLEFFFNDIIEQPYFVSQRRMLRSVFRKNTNSEDLEKAGMPSSGEQWVIDCCKDRIFLHAPIRSMRQQAQRGRYILFPNDIVPYNLDNENRMAFTQIISPIKKDDDCIAGIISVPSQFKLNILKELKLFGISKDVLFCDSPDIVCEGILEELKYKVRGDF